MQTISLCGAWRLWGRSEIDASLEVAAIEAQVPGDVPLDLSRAGLLPADLYYGKNILETEKYEAFEWWYEKRFVLSKEHIAAKERAYLVFEGVDCMAEYFLNGVLIGKSENALISHTFFAGGALKEGENVLTVHIKSSTAYAHGLDYPLHTLRIWGSHHPLGTGMRRAQHSYGWDIMPRAVSSGIWREVKLEIKDPITFSQIFVTTEKHWNRFFYELDCPFSLLSGVEIEIEGACKESRFYERHRVFGEKANGFTFDIPNPQRWFPYGYGDANVYDGEARIYKEGKLIHKRSFSFGIRTVELDRTDKTDGKNGRFRFLINGVEIMCKGSNWVPLDAFHSRDTQRLDRALALAKDVGCNILRCWGGNVYEDHAFFDFCDRNGIMVWQDFAMACHSYPRDDRFKKLITEEAEAVIRKLRQHPSLVLWAGDNEIDRMMYDHLLSPSDNVITRRWLAETVAQNDFGRPYLPSSPYIAEEIFKDRADKYMPEEHLWGPRDYYKSKYYTESLAHFVSETGYHGCPSMASVRRFVSPEKVWRYGKENDEWILHSSDQEGNPARMMLMANQVRQLFGEIPEDADTFATASQISQAEADKFFIERMRTNRPYKTGILWWNLLDGWPQFSDAVVDYYFEKKLAYHYIKRAQAPFVIAAGEISSWCLPLYACNDTLEQKEGKLTVKDGESGEILLETEFFAAANSSALVAKIPVYYSEQKILIFEWQTKDEKSFNHYLCGFPPFSLEKYVNTMKKYGIDRS